MSEQRTDHVVAAHPGWHVLEARWRDDEPRPTGFVRVPIVAWKYTCDDGDGQCGSAEPIVPTYLPSLGDEDEWRAIESPDGAVYDFTYRPYPSASAWLASFGEQPEAKQ